VFRKEIYPEYKSNRKSRRTISGEEQRIISLVRDVGIRSSMKGGYEATT